MNLKSIVLAGVTVMSLAAPAVALADPSWQHDRGYREIRRDRDDWRGREAWDHRGYAWNRRHCFVENRGYSGWNGRYVSRPVEVCR
jgi:hypothetical protein